MSPLSADTRGLITPCPNCGQGNRLAYSKLTAHARCGRCQTDLPPVNRIVEVDGAEAFEALVRQSSLPVFVDFWAPWCGPCRMVAPEIEHLAQLAAGEAVVVKVNTEAVPEVARQFGIQSIPTFVVFQRGTEAARTSGSMAAPRLLEFLRQASR